MEVIFKTECGETTCAVKLGQFCRFFGAKRFGQQPWCKWFDVELHDKEGWVQRCPDCLKSTQINMENSKELARIVLKRQMHVGNTLGILDMLEEAYEKNLPKENIKEWIEQARDQISECY